jgi:PEP-CTERM motif
MNAQRNRILVFLVMVAQTCVAGLAVSPVRATTVMRDPLQGAGFVDVDGGVPLVLGAPAETPLEVDFVFNQMRHIELMEGASTNIEFGIGNTGNDADLDYRIVFDLSDMNGDLLTNDLLVSESTAAAGTINIVALDLTPLPAVIFHDFHIRVETKFVDPNSGGGLFDFYVAGGGGDVGTSVSGPIRFNRAVVGEWVPEPSAILLGVMGLGGLVLVGWRRDGRVRAANENEEPRAFGRWAVRITRG